MQMVFLSNMSFYSFLPLGFFILSLIKWFHTLSKPRRNLPPSPPNLPVLGNLHQLGLLPHRSLHSFSRKYGPLMLIHLGSKPVLVASSADAAREIMKNHELVFANRHKSSIYDRLLYGSRNITFSAYGGYWKKIRSISVLHLLSNKKVQSFRDVREEETSIMIEKIRQRCSSSSVKNLSEIFGTLSNDVVCRVILGRKYGDDENGRQVKAMLLELMEMLGVFNIGDYIPWLEWVNRLNGLDVKLKRLSGQLDEFLETVIEEHKNNRKEAAKTSDFVDILLDLQQKNFNSFPIECDTLKALLLDMFAGGTDTTQTIMEWEMTELLRHPNILEKLHREVREVAAGKPEITEEDLAKMQYLKAVIKETLRLHPPAPLLVPREASQDIEMMGYSIAAGTRAIVNAWAIGRDPQLWEKPEEFQPERFLNSNIDFRGFNFEYIPFGAGRRICPGSTFGLAINELGLAKLVHKFNFALPDGAKPEDLDMTETNGLTVHKNLPLFVLATPYSGN